MVSSSKFNSEVAPSCPPLPPSFLTHSVHAYPFVPTPNTMSWIVLERQRLRRLSLLGQNDYPFSFNVSRTFKGDKSEIPLACASCPGSQAAWRLATGSVANPTHKHASRVSTPVNPVRLPSLCDGSFSCAASQDAQMTPRCKTANKVTPPARSLKAPVNPETWRTNFYVPFSTLEPRPVGNPDNVPMSPRRHRNDIPPVDIVSWQTYSLSRASQSRQRTAGRAGAK